VLWLTLASSQAPTQPLSCSPLPWDGEKTEGRQEGSWFGTMVVSHGKQMLFLYAKHNEDFTIRQMSRHFLGTKDSFLGKVNAMNVPASSSFP